jgi:signal transduction histidine kinase
MRIHWSLRRQFLIFLLLSIFSLAQLTWWVIYQVEEGARISAQQNQLWAEQIRTVQVYSDSFVRSPQAINQWLPRAFPDLQWDAASRTAVVKPEAVQRLRTLAHRRVRMFVSEGTVFSLLLLVGIGYMYWVLHQEILFERRQTSFLSATSHELKTPITSLRLYLDTLLARDIPKAQAAELMATMQQDLDRLTDQIDRLLQVQALGVGAKKVPLQPVNLTEETQALLNEVYGRFDLKGFQFRTRLDPDITVMAHPQRWQILVRNLLENAFKYSPHGGALDILLTRQNGRAHLRVSDQGMGFSPIEARRIFDRFYRVGSEDTRQTRGAGLGLYLVREITLSFGGTVEAKSEGEGRGASFIVEIPLCEDHRHA